VAAGAVERLKKAEPAAFMSKAAAKLVEVGNIDDDLGRVAECDWVIEAIVEKIELKHALYEKLEGVRRPGTAVSSNTSTIPLDRLIEGAATLLPAISSSPISSTRRAICACWKLWPGPRAIPRWSRVSDFADRAMGKTVVRAKDTPGFLANRVGTYWLQAAINAAFELGVSVEDADAIGGKPMGVPKTGIFGLVDLVGIDLMPYLKASLTSTLPANDPYQAIAYDHPLILKMIADYTGRKGKGGFYRINREAGKVKEAIDLATGDYAKAKKPVSIPSAAQKDLRALISAPGMVGAYAWPCWGRRWPMRRG
jgi:3-hydroxyacyl-CoA dehydrogenase